MEVLTRLGERDPEATLTRRLGVLEHASLVELLTVRPELAYAFRHALIQEAAYEEMLKAERRILHRAAGQVMEVLFAEQLDESASTLAYHFERGEDWPRALHWLTRAAERAAKQMALREAIDLYRRALACLGHLPEDRSAKFELQLQLAHALMLIGAESQVTRTELDRALELAAEPRQLAQAHFRYGEFLHIYTASDLPSAEQHYHAALDLLREGDDAEFYSTLLAQLGYLYRYQRRTALAVETLERALAMARRVDAHRVETGVLLFISGAYIDAAREDDALTTAEQGLALAESLGDLELIGRAHSFLSDVYLDRAAAGRGAPELALPHLQEMRRHGQEYGISVLAGFGTGGLGVYYELVGDQAAAQEAYAEAAQIWRRAGARRRAGGYASDYARLLLLEGDTQAAEKVLAEMRDDFADAPGRADLEIGMGYASAGKPVQACACLERAFADAVLDKERERWLSYIESQPQWKRGRELPQVAALLARLKEN